MAKRQNNRTDEVPIRVAINDVRYWRDCARRMRAEARIARDPRLKALMRDIANRYARLARWTEQHTASGGWIERLLYGRALDGDGRLQRDELSNR
jgi:hypothetical protein